MSPLDAWFLHLERASQQLHIGSALIFEGPAPTYADLCGVVAARLDGVPRYRQRFRRVPLALGRPVWVDDVHFRVEHHLRHAALPAPGSDAQLRTLAGRLMSQSLDPEQPLWETWLV
ncbi:MAG: wax ester/triacylglycerol synthase domain-containing protein, partial [Kineosporiaceae bacterium]